MDEFWNTLAKFQPPVAETFGYGYLWNKMVTNQTAYDVVILRSNVNNLLLIKFLTKLHVHLVRYNQTSLDNAKELFEQYKQLIKDQYNGTIDV